MKTKGLLALAAGLACFTHTAYLNADTLQPYKATYGAEVSSIPVKGSANRELTVAKDGSYHLSFSADIVIVDIAEQSRFSIQDNHVVPASYHYKRGGFAKTKEDSLSFDWKNMQVQNQADEDVKPFAITKQTLDPLSYQFQLRLDLANNKKDLTYKVADEDEVKTYSFKRLGEEVIDSPLGKLKTVKVKRVRENKKRETTLWFAKEWDYILVRLQQLEESKVYDIYLQKASINGKPVGK
ncbi:DUF3108 domain-containing protein [Zooshikella harenae]|uniref:DUF3108 domain-containing protein n=1 Tax=Zooshikella harenae TaxID=2827238 RepID=A0ABS5Z8L5_9GAMM|nr:DUF3108 domain-containing protein [Zooshikella harenae]MBU2710263.1 DUF3108 domain-containing protein [Zooshikella harenae]